MRRLVRALSAAALACLSLAGCGAGAPATVTTAAPVPISAARRLSAFGSQAELRAFLEAMPRPARPRPQEFLSLGAAKAPGIAAMAPSGAQSLTNVQHAGVDEGDIVKAHGEHLVVLRRGRLFTLKITADGLTPVSTIDAFAPALDPQYDWYDELLVSGDTVVVVGYSYQRGGTELGLFDIDAGGRLAYRATYQIRSNDYYSSRNYASRLVGNRLVFYTPLDLGWDAGAAMRALPAMRKWRPRGRAEFKPIYTPGRLYRSPSAASVSALHTVISCDLGAPELRCEATGVMGPAGRVFYVAPEAVYVWLTEWGGGATAPPASWLYRLPLDGGEPGAVRVSGSPIDQFSFLEDASHVNVVVRSHGRGDGMWRSEMTAGDVALLRLPRWTFSAGPEEASPAFYRPLPPAEMGSFQNRFVGNFLLYGAGSGWRRPASRPGSVLIVYPYVADGVPVAVPVGHAIDRIEPLGADAIVVGGDGRDLHFSSVALSPVPVLTGRYTRPDAAQGELRSHGFFYRADGRDSGIVGLPVRAGGSPGYEHLVHGSAAVVFLKNDALALRELGELRAQAAVSPADGCRTSCVDWYGNARPLFLGERIFGLLGYEIVEGRISGGRLDERGRLSFAPAVNGR
jgi:hypothetical protein